MLRALGAIYENYRDFAFQGNRVLVSAAEPSPTVVSRTGLSEGAPQLYHLRGATKSKGPHLGCLVLHSPPQIHPPLQRIHTLSRHENQRSLRWESMPDNRDQPSYRFALFRRVSTYKKAFRREHQIKRWSRSKKEALVAGDLNRLKKSAMRNRT